MNLLTEDILKEFIREGDSWLDVGCGTKPFAKLFAKSKSYIGIDVEVSGRDQSLKHVDKHFNGTEIPFEVNSFDGILCTQVLEHATEVNTLTTECFRVLRPGGVVVLSVPFIFREHEQPYDFRRFTSFGIEKLLRDSGFQCKKIHKCMSGIECIGVLLSVYLSNNLGRNNKLTGLFISLFFCLPIQVTAYLLSKVLPDNHDLYSTLVVVADKPILKN